MVKKERAGWPWVTRCEDIVLHSTTYRRIDDAGVTTRSSKYLTVRGGSQYTLHYVLVTRTCFCN